MRVGVVLGLIAWGCSYVVVRTPDPLPPGDEPSCTSMPVAPIVDVVIASGMVALAAAQYFVFEPSDSRVDVRGVAAVSTVVTAIPFGFSARHGFRATARCREQEAAYARYYDEDNRQEQAPLQHLGRAGEACWPDGTCDPRLSCTAERRCDMQRDQ